MRDIAQWLDGLGLGQYAAVFAANAIDDDVLPDLTDADLERLGVPLGHRRKLLRAIAALSRDAAAPEAASGLPPRAEAERRQLTVMLCDLVGSTALSQQLDPEEMRGVIRAYQNTVAGEIVRFEGHVAKFMGDGVLAYFGWPRAHEDEAERAVRAGLAITEAVARLTAPTGERLAARVGIATGLVVVGDLVGEGAAQEEAVVGGTPNLAARLQALAEPGTLVIADGTRRLLGELFEYADAGEHELKGFSAPVRAWCVLSESRSEGRFEALHGAALMPLVGREQELALLLDRWQLAKAGEGQVVLLSGEPGIGKSRIVLALRERLRGESRISLRYHGSPYHAHSALWPLIGHLKRAAGLVSGDPPEASLDKLERLLGQAVSDTAVVVPLVAELLGIAAAGRYAPLELTPQQTKARTFRALIEQVEGLAAQKPVLMIFEDAQWSDPTTLELFDLLVERAQRLPVLLVVTFRPEFRPRWAGYDNVTLLTLTRLGRGQAAEVAARVTGGKTLPHEVLEQILAKADGVPLFIEELTKTVLESGLLEDMDGAYRLIGRLPPMAIPATLHDSLLARLDRLASVKEVAQIGAAIGREFGHDLLAAVADMEEHKLVDALRQLIEAELVFRRGLPPEATYVFKHALVQDAAHASLLTSRRRQLHARIADALGHRSPEPPPELLARHLTEAGLAEPASEAWARAGLAALERSAMAEAAAALQQAVALLRELPDSAERKRREIELLGRLAVALTHARGLTAAEVEQAHERAGALAGELGDAAGWFRARWGLWFIQNGRARFPQAIAIADELLAQTEREGNTDFAVHAHHALWSSHFFQGDLQTGRMHTERGLAIYDVARHGSHASVFGGHDARECALTQRGNILFMMGFPEQARVSNAKGLAHAMMLGQPQLIAHAHNFGSLLLQLAGDFTALRDKLSALLALREQYAFANWHPEARILEAWLVACCEGDRRAPAIMRDHLDRRTATGTAYWRSYFLMLIADAWLRLGDTGEAMAAANEGLAHAAATGEHLCTAELHRLAGRARLARDARDLAGAEAAFLAALSDARARAARLFELRAAADLARLWAARREHAKAYDLLAPIYAWFTEGFGTPDLKDAKALLDALR